MKTSFALVVIALLILVSPGTKRIQSPPVGESLERLELAEGPDVGEEQGDADGIEPTPDYVPPEPFIAQEAVPLLGSVGPNTLVNSREVCPGGRGIVQSETMFAVFGDTIVAAFNDSRGFYCPQPRSTLGWAYSFDGGQTFTDGGTLPGGSTLWSNGDPWVVVDQDGNFYISGISNNFRGMSVSRGTITEDGIAWSDPVQATFGSSGTDKEALAVDQSAGLLYMVYDINAQRVELVRSNDQAATWTTPRVLPLPGGIGAFPVIEQDTSRIYVSWLVGFGTSNQRIVFTSSNDYGETFGSPVEISRVCPFTVLGFSRGQVPAFPSVAQDKTGGPYDGRLYVAFHSACDGVGSAYLSSSDDGGLTWTLPAVVPDDTSGITFSPTVSVDDFGTVSVAFYDRRENPGTGITNVYFTRSFDGGATFEPNFRITEVATNWSAVASDITPNMGDYMASKTNGSLVYVNWSDGRAGDPDSYFTIVSPASGAKK